MINLLDVVAVVDCVKVVGEEHVGMYASGTRIVEVGVDVEEEEKERRIPKNRLLGNKKNL